MRVFIITLALVLSLKADSLQDNQKIFYTNLIGSTAIISWGVLNWDYGKRSIHANSEGWFGKDTKYRGIDKAGHFYTTFALSNYFANLYEGFGYDKAKAIKQGAISSLCLNTVMEIGDGFSDYGFSYEDFIVNILGSYLGYYLLMHPKVDDIVDIRLEYKPSKKITSGDSYDIFTDYDGMKFLAAIKLNGFTRFQDSFLKYVEFHTGYYTRREGTGIERYPYVGVGVNLSLAFKPINRKVSKFFEYYQLPYSYVGSD